MAISLPSYSEGMSIELNPNQLRYTIYSIIAGMPVVPIPETMFSEHYTHILLCYSELKTNHQELVIMAIAARRRSACIPDDMSSSDVLDHLHDMEANLSLLNNLLDLGYNATADLIDIVTYYSSRGMSVEWHSDAWENRVGEMVNGIVFAQCRYYRAIRGFTSILNTYHMLNALISSIEIVIAGRPPDGTPVEALCPAPRAAAEARPPAE